MAAREGGARRRVRWFWLRDVWCVVVDGGAVLVVKVGGVKSKSGVRSRAGGIFAVVFGVLGRDG